MREKYETDLADEQWEIIAPLFGNMRKYKWDKRELVNAVLYLVKTTGAVDPSLKKICGDGGYVLPRRRGTHFCLA